MPRRTLAAVLMVGVAILVAPVALASDGDSDKIEDYVDNCVGAANPFQFDADRDGEGDLCERPILIADEFVGTYESDLVFGGFRTSVLSGGAGTDSLYGEAGDDLLDGGPGRDGLAGGPGNDRLTGGPGCDVFGIETRIEQRDVFTDFVPTIDRVRFPPLFRSPSRARLPRPVSVPGQEDLTIGFVVADEPVSTVVFEGLATGAPVVLSTEPCGKGPPPAGVCPHPGAFRTLLFIGYEDVFCPNAGRLHLDTGIYATSRIGVDAAKQLGDRLSTP